MDAADNFLRWSRHHLGNGRPEQFERARARLVESLELLGSVGNHFGSAKLRMMENANVVR